MIDVTLLDKTCGCFVSHKSHELNTGGLRSSKNLFWLVFYLGHISDAYCAIGVARVCIV